MKIFFALAIILVFSHSLFAQAPRRTLIEEFTSSSSDSCATADFIVDQFEGESAKKFCIVKWYLPYGSQGGANPFYNDYPLSKTRSETYYNNSKTLPQMILNGMSRFDPFGLSVAEVGSKVMPEYSKTSPFTMDVSSKVFLDSVITTVTIHSFDTTLDLSRTSLGVIITERYNQTIDANHFPYHTNIVRKVLPSLDPTTGEIRDALPFAIAMQGRTMQTFRFAAKLGATWDRYGLVAVGVIQDNTSKEVLQCGWSLPDISFTRPTTSTYLFKDGATPAEFTLRNWSDTDITITPQLTNNFPIKWNIILKGMTEPRFVLPANSSVTGTFISANAGGPFAGSGDFTMLLRVGVGAVAANLSGTLVGNDSRDLILKNWASSVYKSDPDVAAWTQFGLDPAIMNEDALGNLFSNNLRRFRTVYFTRSNFGDSSELEILRDYMQFGGRMIFQSNAVNKYFSTSILDTVHDKYAVNFLNIFQTTPLSISNILWTKGNVVKGPVFADTLLAPFAVTARPIEALTPADTHYSKPMLFEQDGKYTGVSVRSYFGKLAYMTFPLSDIHDPNQAGFIMGKILAWFQIKEKVGSAKEEENSIVYPNPISTIATIRWNSLEKADMKFYDELGRGVFPNVQYGTDELHLDCSMLSAGTYYYLLITGEKTARGKIIIAR